MSTLEKTDPIKIATEKKKIPFNDETKRNGFISLKNMYAQLLKKGLHLPLCIPGKKSRYVAHICIFLSLFLRIGPK